MPDTGAPWNIPYVEPADLVRDYPAADEAQALAIAGGLSKALIKVSQVQTTTNFSTSSSTNVDLTGVTVTVTPSAATSRFLLMFTANVESNNNNGQFFFQFDRSSTLLFEEVEYRYNTGSNPRPVTFSMMFDEVAGDTSARTYKVVVRSPTGTLTVSNSSFSVIEYAV
jgi:hypothetical protein